MVDLAPLDFTDAKEHRRKIAQAVNQALVPTATGSTTPRPLSDRFGEVVNVKDHGAVGDGVTDDSAVFRTADDAAALDGGFVFIPRGTYRLNSDFKHLDGDGINSRGWIGEGPEATILRFAAEVADSRLITVASSFDTSKLIVRPERPDTVSPASDLAVLQAQTTLGVNVTLVTPSDNTKFAVDDWVTVSCGGNPFDADDNLWRYSVITRINKIDAGTGVITLADPMEEPLNDDGWGASGGGKNAEPDWADSTAYVVDDVVYDSLDNDSLWKALTAGTSSGTQPSDDVNVTWQQIWGSVTGGIGPTKGAIDRRPTIQLVRNPRVGVVMSGFTLDNIGSVASDGIDFRSCYGCLAENIWATGNILAPFQATESSRNITYRKCVDQSDHVDSNRSFWSYQARNVLVDDCVLAAETAGGSEAVAYIESNADVTFRDTTIAGTQGSLQGVVLDYATVAMDGCKVLGLTRPVAVAASLNAIVPERRDYHRMANLRGMRGNLIDVAPADPRRMWTHLMPNQQAQYMQPGNTFRFSGNLTSPYTQSDPILFEPTRLVEYVVQLTPLASQADVVIPLPGTPEQGIFDIEDIRAVFLGCRVKWDSAPASGEIDIIPRGYDGTSNRRLLASANPVDRIRVTDVQPTGQLFESNGTTNRLIDNKLPNGGRERIQLSYVSNASAGGGTIYVTMMLLVEEGFAGDFEG